MNAKRALRSCLAAGLLSLAATAGATTYYVDPVAGNNGNAGTSTGQSFQTLAHALTVVVDDDVIVLSGTANESIVIDKDIRISGGTIRCPSFPGVVIASDGVSLSNVQIIQADANTAAGTLLLAEESGGDGMLDDVELYGVILQGSSSFSATGNGAVQLAHFRKVRGLTMTYVDFHAMKGSSADSALLIEGAGIDPATSAGNWITNTTYDVQGFLGPWPPYQGDAIVLRPTSGMGVSDFHFETTLIHFGYDRGIVLEDSGTGAGEGVSDISFRTTSVYDVDTCVEVIAQGSSTDSQAGISDVTFYGNDSSYYFTSSDYGFRFVQSSGGVPNLDLNSLRVTQTAIFADILAVDNQLASGLVNFENCWWGNASGPSGAGPGTGAPVSTGVDFSPWFLGSLTASTIANITTPGGSTTFSCTVPNGGLEINVDLNDGVTGSLEIAGLNSPLFPSGYGGMIDQVSTLPAYLNVETDLADGSFLALVKLRYNEFTVVTTLGLAETDVVVYNFNVGSNWWAPAVLGNTAGTPQWEGDSPVPTLPLSPADLGRYGVDTANNIAWAVVDHFTDFTSGKGLNGLGEAASRETDWQLY